MAFITGWSYPVSIGVIGLATVVYTYFGGIKAVVWVDVVQMCLYVGGAVVSIIALQTLVPGGWSEIITSAREAGKMTIIESSFDLSVPYTIWAGVIGGGFLTMASHGTDQLIVQRILSCGDITAAKKAMIGSGLVVLGQIFIFLMVGLGLWRYYDAATFASSDQIFAEFVVEALPPGISGLLVAGVFAAAMSSLSSSINALASATTYDFFAVMSQKDDAALLKVGKLSTLVWSALLIGGAILFIPFSEGSAAVEVALSVSSIAYGGLLGAFLVAVFSISKDQVSVISGMVLAIGTVTFIWLFARDAVAWPWFVPIGSAITVLVAGILGRVRVSSSRESKS
jgi:Na+/proline symporter